jgi:hypothetical protein
MALTIFNTIHTIVSKTGLEMLSSCVTFKVFLLTYLYYNMFAKGSCLVNLSSTVNMQ